MNIPTFFDDIKFCHNSDARPLRILSEYIGPQQRLAQFNVHHTIVFFGSARITSPEQAKKDNKITRAKVAQQTAIYYEQARQLAYKITKWALKMPENIRPYLITGGGGGIMEAGNRGAKEAGGLSIGMSILLPDEHVTNAYCTQEASMRFHYFFMRKFWLLFRTRAFVIFPGGFGTIDELFEILTLIKTKKVREFPIVLFGSDFWNALINFQMLVDWNLISEKDLKLFKLLDSVDEASHYLQTILTHDYLVKADNQ